MLSSPWRDTDANRCPSGDHASTPSTPFTCDTSEPSASRILMEASVATATRDPSGEYVAIPPSERSCGGLPSSGTTNSPARRTADPSGIHPGQASLCGTIR